jgi:hypothetical protein
MWSRIVALDKCETAVVPARFDACSAGSASIGEDQSDLCATVLAMAGHDIRQRVDSE